MTEEDYQAFLAKGGKVTTCPSSEEVKKDKKLNPYLKYSLKTLLEMKANLEYKVSDCSDEDEHIYLPASKKYDKILEAIKSKQSK